MLLPLNKDNGIVALYDRVFKIKGNGVTSTKEQHKIVTINEKNASSKKIAACLVAGKKLG